ncbi:MAG TPA: methyl-accepting chemotaxis protein [archaeon]|nr:methyl-accepting chemotaxis protein [archaeon]
MKWSIGKKIGGGFTISLLIISLVCLVSYININQLLETNRRESHTNQVILMLEKMLSNLRASEAGERGYIMTGLDIYSERYKDQSGKVLSALDSIKEISISPNVQKNLDVIRPLITEELSVLEKGINLRREEGLEAALKMVQTEKDEVQKTSELIRNLVREIGDEEDKLLEARHSDAESDAQKTKQTIILGFIFGVVFLSLAGFFITRNITVPLDQVVSISKQIASGDLPGNFTDKGRGDEIGILLEAFSNMTRYLKEKVGLAEQIAAGDLRVDVKVSSEKDILGNALSSMVENLQKQTHKLTEGISTLASSASEISASVAELASGTAETATSISETSTTMEEVKQTSQMANKKAKYVSDIAQQTEQISKDGKKATDNTTEGMNDIREQMESIGESIMRLSEQSQAIGEIIATVNDLADQSNLLAVNAAIEAAKAGEQGKGFTVVAQEIKNLAEQSKKATSQVQGILSEIQKATGVAVMVAEQGAKAVEKGVKQSAQAGESILALSNSVAEAAQAAVQIAAASQQQMVGIDQAATAMENIKQASSQNSASTKQLETAALTIAELGQELKQLTERYKI